MNDKNRSAYDTYVLLQRVTYMIRRAREYEVKQELGITLAKTVAILAIKAADNPITPSELSRKIHREAHSVHELVNRMEKDGLVIKVKDPRWSRKVIIELTPKGEEINTRARNSSIIKKIFSSLSTKERKNFYSYVEKLRLKTLTEFAISKEA